MKRALTAAFLIVAGSLSLAACGGGTAQGGAASNAPASASASRTQSPDLEALASLCSQYCNQLKAQEHVCPMGTTNLIGCSFPLGQGADAVLAVEKGLARVNPSMKDVPDLLVSISKAEDAFKKWESGTCIIPDANDPSFASVYPGGKNAILMCQLNGQLVSTTQATVGVSLSNAALQK